VNIKQGNLSDEALLFGESQSRVILSFGQENLKKIKKMAQDHKLSWEIIGTVEKQHNLLINDKINVPLAVLIESWTNGIPRRMNTS